jgi:hypothetical protein
VDSSSSYVANTWAHIVVSVDGTTMKIYKDGVLTGTTTDGHEPARLTRTQHWIGRSAWSSNDYLDGAIAYVRFWDGEALDDQQVATLYDERDHRPSIFSPGCMVNMTLTVPHSANTITVGYSSGIDEDANDEIFGFGALTIELSNSVTSMTVQTIVDRPGDSGWDNTAAACGMHGPFDQYSGCSICVSHETRLSQAEVDFLLPTALAEIREACMESCIVSIQGSGCATNAFDDECALDLGAPDIHDFSSSDWNSDFCHYARDYDWSVRASLTVGGDALFGETNRSVLAHYYEFSPPSSGNYTLSTCGSKFDTTLAVFITDGSGVFDAH